MVRAPLIAAQMARIGLLKANSFPSLHRSLFSGEALPRVVAEAWQAAAPNSKVVNLWGATEISVMGIGQEYSLGLLSDRRFYCDRLALSWSEDGHRRRKPEAPGRRVKRRITTRRSATCAGYPHGPGKRRVRILLRSRQKWYRTGDRAFKDAEGVLHYPGRIDHQVKVLGGARVELGEIESNLRLVTGGEFVAAVAWPMQDGVALGIVGFIGGFNGKAAERPKRPERKAASQYGALADSPDAPHSAEQQRKGGPQGNLLRYSQKGWDRPNLFFLISVAPDCGRVTAPGLSEGVEPFDCPLN